MKTCNSHKYEYDYLTANKPLLKFDKNRNFNEWQEECKNKLNELLGLPLEKCDSEFEIEYEKECDGFINIRFTVQTEPGYFVPCHLFVPNTKASKYPLCICLSGHATGMHMVMGEPKNENDAESLKAWPQKAIATRAVKEGYIALVIEARNFGESSVAGYGTSCDEAGKIALIMGRTVVGERVWDAMRILDAVGENFPQVDMENIVCTGNSGGGTATFYLSCLEPRIKISAPSCAVCTYEDSIAAVPHCLCNHIPSIRKYFEMADLTCLIAPRPFLLTAGIKDEIFPIHGVEKTFEEVKEIYKAANASDNCHLLVGDNGHFYYANLIFEKLREINK